MPNIKSALKEEICRLARKEARVQMAPMRKAAITHRKEIAAIKKILARQEKTLARLAKEEPRHQPQPLETNGQIPESFRYSARSVRARRKKLGLSAQEYAKLIGVSMQTVYAWEQKRARPRRSQMTRIVWSRNLSRLEAHRALGLVS